jgi:TPR repeat protein
MARNDMMASANGTSAEALFHLGMMYCIGRDVDQDYVSAHKWFNIAALRGNAAAKEYRCEISREMTMAQIAEAQRQARDWIKSH